MHTVMDLLVTGLWWTLCALVARKAGIPDEFYWENMGDASSALEKPQFS